MIRLSCKIPPKVILACSGGRDSMSALEFLIRGKREVIIAYFNHKTTHGNAAESFLRDFCNKQELSLTVGEYKHKDPKKKPTEASWREERYKFLSQFNEPIITAHHLRDAVEWWIFSSLRGCPTLIPVERGEGNISVLRPFIKTHPDKLHHFNEYEHIEDPTNRELNHTRNFIRHELLDRALHVNPGLYTTIKNLYERKNDDI